MANSQVMGTLNSMPGIGNFLSFCRIAAYYSKRFNLFQLILFNVTNTVRELLTFNHKLKVARYNVNRQRYRLNQMESLIDSNSADYGLGRKINHLR